MQCPLCQHENPAIQKFCGECGTSRASPNQGGSPAASYADLQREVERLTRALSEALEQQTATSEILRVISSSPTDVQPVLDAVAENAALLCGADDAVIRRIEGDTLRLVARFGSIPLPDLTRPITRDYPAGLAVIERRTIHIDDISPRLEAEFPRVIRGLGLRTVLATPLLREGVPIGVIIIRRTQIQPFTDKQITLLKTFADQAVIAIENVRLFTQLEFRNHDLTTALDRQTATSEILRVISSSPTDAQPVFDAILRSAVTLCNSLLGNVVRVDGDLVRLVATLHPRPEEVAAIYPAPLTAPLPPCRAIRQNTVVHVSDVEAAGAIPPAGLQVTRAAGIRSLLVVPMRRNEQPIGAILIARPAVGPFPDEQIALLQTFADQAVIAIENVRLFTELQHKNEALTHAHAQVSEALDQQTATSEILRTIAHAQTDTQPVFDTIVRSAARLCHAANAALFLTHGGMLYEPANYGSSPEALAATRARYPRPVGMDTTPGMAILTRSVVHVPDTEDPSAIEHVRQGARLLGFRGLVTVPMLREGEPVGAIIVTHRDPGLFSDGEVELLKTFADQAVIAVENVRLFTELQTKNQALTDAHAQVTEALEQQTATSRILSVISSSPTDVEPVFRTILASTNRLCEASFSILFLWDGEALTAAAAENVSPTLAEKLRTARVRPREGGSPVALTALEHSVVHVADVLTDSRFSPANVPAYWIEGARSILSVPMLREGNLVGVINTWRLEPMAFTDKQIELLKTFADQAVIDVENVRWFKELEARTADLTRSVEQLTALSEVGRAVSSTLDLEMVLTTIVSRAVQLSGLDGGVVFEYDEGSEEFVQRAQAETGGVLATARRTTRVRRGEGVVGQTALTLEPAQVPDITAPGAYDSRLRGNLIESGVRAILAVPMVREGQLIGCLVVSRNRPGNFPAEAVELLRTFATQSALAIQNARLFHEIADKSRQLEAASQHKSEFLANMSHELRTPLNAIIGFSEVLTERMFGELNEKEAVYLKDIYASGTHLLSLINDILDLSKIEAGRMELELTDFDLPTALDSALTLVRERAGRRGITLEATVDELLGEVRGDERKIRQIVLNLLSNAIKFTREGGRIEVAAVPKDGSVEVSVTDTGVDIAPEDQEAVFEEFRQVGTSAAKQEGTGLGLALCRKFVELHGGKIGVTSQVGVGSIFTFTIPVRCGE